VPASADLVVVNARILTMDEANPSAQAIALRGGTILAIGGNDQIRALSGPATEVIDAGGATVLPGFIEAHMHLFPGAAELDHLQLSGVHGFEALAHAVRQFAAKKPAAPILVAQGVDYTVLGTDTPVTRHHLDAILPDRAFIMCAPDHHTAWANTRALEDAGILHGLAVGPGNEVVMGEDGLALGELREGEAFGPVLALAGEERTRLGLSTGGDPDPTPTDDERATDRAIMRRGLAWCARHGITSIQNMDGNPYQLELLSEIEAGGDLICRVKIPFHFKNFMTHDALDIAESMRTRFNSEWLSSNLVKVFYDGVLDSWTAVMIEPYADRPDWVGEPLFSPEQFASLAKEIDRRGFQIAVHAIGDGAVRSVLDGYEAARQQNGTRDSRHRIEHIEVTTQADVPRFAEMGVIASMQPPHPPGAMGFPLEPTVSRIGRERWALAYACKTIKDSGARVVFASDWPVAPIDPLACIQAAMERKVWADGLPDQRFSLHEAIGGYTREGAYAGFVEDRLGMLREGYLADLVILDGNVEASPVASIGSMRVATTICGGRVTYKA